MPIFKIAAVIDIAAIILYILLSKYGGLNMPNIFITMSCTTCNTVCKTVLPIPDEFTADMETRLPVCEKCHTRSWNVQGAKIQTSDKAWFDITSLKFDIPGPIKCPICGKMPEKHDFYEDGGSHQFYLYCEGHLISKEKSSCYETQAIINWNKEATRLGDEIKKYWKEKS